MEWGGFEVSDISAIIDVFRMEEISKKKRASIIITLGEAINYSMAANVTEALVWELVETLEPDNDIFKSERYFYYYHQWNGRALVNCFTFYKKTPNGF